MLEKITPELLTEALRQRGGLGDGVVTGYDHRPVGTGQMAQSHRLALTVEGGGPDTPTSVVAKLPTDDPTSRQMAAATAAYLREVRYYELFGDPLAIRTLAGTTPRSTRMAPTSPSPFAAVARTSQGNSRGGLSLGPS